MSFLDRLKLRLATNLFDAVHGLRYLATGSARHEGHFDHGEWRNWSDSYRVRPAQYSRPGTIDDAARIVAQSGKLRVVGGGHSFNDSPLCEDTLLSLDRLNRIIEVDPASRRVRVEAGIRLRDLNAALWSHGLGLPVLGSTDTQSIGGLIATDLHGTGRDFGFLSERVRSLKVIAANGEVRSVAAGDPLFHAAFGAIGVCGPVVEAEIEAVPSFHLAKTTEMVDRIATENEIEAVLARNEHVSFYYVSGDTDSETVRMHAWNRTADPVTEDWEDKKTLSELTDFGISAFAPPIAELLAAIDEDSLVSNLLAPDHRIVMPGSVGFGRRLFYRHDEIEYGVPFDQWRACVSEVMEMLNRRDYFSVVEVRFTPDKSQALLGPGVGRRTAYIELATPLSQPVEEVYAEAERIFLAHGGQPHLGKKTSVTGNDMARIFGQRFDQFLAVKQRQDPDGKFSNPFTARVFEQGV